MKNGSVEFISCTSVTFRMLSAPLSELWAPALPEFASHGTKFKLTVGSRQMVPTSIWPSGSAYPLSHPWKLNHDFLGHTPRRFRISVSCTKTFYAGIAEPIRVISVRTIHHRTKDRNKPMGLIVLVIATSNLTNSCSGFTKSRTNFEMNRSFKIWVKSSTNWSSLRSHCLQSAC